MKVKHCLALLALVAPVAPRAQTIDPTAWRADLQRLTSDVARIHPDAFYRQTRAAWDAAVADVDRRLPGMRRDQALVAFMQLVARVRDGHTSINPIFDTRLNLHRYPVEFARFHDGLFIKSAGGDATPLAGAKVRRMGSISADSAFALASTLIGAENAWWPQAMVPGYLMFGELLSGLGIAAADGALTLDIEKDGASRVVTLRPTMNYQPAGHGPRPPAPPGWVDMRGVTAAAWQEQPERLYWHRFSASDSTLYVVYRAVVSIPGDPVDQFWRGVFAAADTLPVKRLVLDLRENSGGNSFFNRQVIRGIVARPKLDQRGRLFAIISPVTFSAAMNLALDLEAWTNVTFVGSPTGNATVFYGDHEQVLLPNSGITVNVSTLPWYPDDPRDKRAAITPAMYTPLTSTDYRTGNDPAMRAILSGADAAWQGALHNAASKGDSLAAVGVLRAAAADSLFRFRSPESQVNAFGYNAMRDKNTQVALFLFRLNAAVFPRSPNVWDSLGEGLVAAGQREAGIAAYRKALELDPGSASARQALERLTGGHD